MVERTRLPDWLVFGESAFVECEVDELDGPKQTEKVPCANPEVSHRDRHIPFGEREVVGVCVFGRARGL